MKKYLTLLPKINQRRMKLTKNQEAVLKALGDSDNYRPSLKRIKEATGINDNRSVLNVIRALKKKGLLDLVVTINSDDTAKITTKGMKQNKELISSVFPLDTSGTTSQGVLNI